MTVSENENVVYNWNGDGSSTTFDFDFLIEEHTQLVVMFTNANGIQETLQKDVDYTIAEIGNLNGSHINYPIEGSSHGILAEDEIISLILDLPIIQDTPYSESEKLVKSRLERNFDYLTRLIAIQNRKIERSVKIQEGATTTPDELIEALNNSAIQAQRSATASATSASQSEQYATNALTSANNAEESYNKTVAKETEFLQEAETKKTEITNLSNTQKSDITSLGANVKNNIRSLGIFMQDDRLFYYDVNGVKHEFRNDFGGIAPMPIKHKEIKKVSNGYALTWTDPDDSVYKENLYCKWDNTLIVAKENDYPQSPYDGIVVLKSTVRNAYQSNAYIFECDTTKDYKFRAFPCSTNRVYSYEDRNKFGSWIYGYIECLTESNEQKRIQYIEDNEHFNPSYMDFTNDEFKEMDWKGSPFYDWDYLRPCMVYNDKATDSEGNSLNGQIMEYLNPNDLTKTIDGQASHNADKTCNANAMMEKRGIFTYYKKEGNYEIIKFSNIKHSDEWECYSTLKADGTYDDFYYTPIYECGLVDNILRSLSGLAPMNSQTGTNEITYARANGNGWDTEVEADDLFERRVFKLLFKRLNSQEALGQGKSNGGQNASALLNTGTMDKKGNNWGSSSTANGIKFRGRENFYGNRWDRKRGLVFINGIPYVKHTKHTGDGSTATDYNTTGVGFIALTDVPLPTGSSGGYASSFYSTKYGVFSIVVSGSATTGNCDGRWFNNAGEMYPYRGGSSLIGSLCGAFALASDFAVSYAYWDLGAALSYKKSS